SLTPERKQRLRENLSPERAAIPATIVELPARSGQRPADATQDFVQLVHLLLAFARQVKHCEIRHEDGRTEALKWEEKPVNGSELVRVGLLEPSGKSRLQPSPAVVLTGPSCGLLILLGDKGFKALPA